MNSTITQIVAGLLAVLVPALTKLATDWSEEYQRRAKEQAASAARGDGRPPTG